jgi:CheY-like chemotaxis protein
MAESIPKDVLIVDDDRFLRRACEASLKQLGLHVRTAADGVEALEAVSHKRPDLILLDLVMPRMQGLDVVRALKGDERTRTIPVLVLSNSSREADVRHVIELGAVGHFVKSNLSLRELRDRVMRLLEEPA